MQPKSIYLAGAVLMAVGLVMIPLPGPGALLVATGLVVLVIGLVVSVTGRRRKTEH